MLNSLSIPKKLAGAFAIVIAAALTMGFFAYMSALDLEHLTADNDKADREQFLASELEIGLMHETIHLRGYLLTGNRGYAERAAQSVQRFETAAEEFTKSVKDEKSLELARSAIGRVRSWRKERAEPLMALVAGGNIAAAQASFNADGSANRASTLTDPLQQLTRVQIDKVHATISAMDAASGEERKALVIGLTAMIALAVGMWFMLTKLIGKPVTEMTGVMTSLAQGDNKVDVEGTNRGDEIGSMAKAVLVFRDAAVAKEAMEVERQRAEREQKLVVDSLQHGLAELAKGDLTQQIDAEFGPDYAAVKTNFNEAVAGLRELIGSVTRSAEAIRTGSNEIAQASEDLARRTEANAASLEQTTAAVTQMDDRLKASAESAGRTVTRADGAIATVSDGRTITDDTVQAMTRVSESAKGIDSVIEGLDKIAFQTRVLAMNAAVEAGRAGEAGRGFAVVADLVSALAMRAEEEAGRARDQLTATQTDIVTAVEMVQRVDGALENISGDVGEVHKLLAEMAADNQAQSTAVSEISTAIGAMDQATQQNAAMVEETSAAARNLSSEVNTLADQAARFTIDNGRASTNALPARPRAAKPRTAAAAPAKEMVQVPSTVLNGAGGHEEWASF